jgi:hypothetical protein
MFEKISTALMSLFSNLSKIQSQYNVEASNLEGFPALTLTPSGNESAYDTTTENRRVYGFVVRLYVERGSGTDAERTAESTMRDLVDTVLDRLDKNYYFGGTTIPSQTGYTFLFVESAPSKWGYAGRENEMRVAEVNIKVHFHIDTTLIS